MNKIKFLVLAFASLLVTGCMNSGFGDDEELESRGNEAIHETNVISISQLKNQYKSYITTDYRDGTSYTQITDDVQIKGVVTGNDVEGNIYSEISLQDNTGAIIIAISEGGICGYLPVGTEIVVDLKGLYIGNYGKQAEIGTPYTNNKGQTYVSRMSRLLWNDHFKYTGNKVEVTPVEFNNSKWDTFADGGKLAVLKNVQFNVSNDSTTFANPGSAGSKSIYFKNMGNTVMLYTSNYADFAGMYVPTGKVNVTGIVKTFNNSKEFVIRSIKDIQPAE